MIRFISLAISPWSEKARWALLHHGIDFVEESYIPGLMEPILRLRLRKLRGRVTVPVLHDGTRFYTDSFDIVRWAESHGTGAPLLPKDKLGEIEAYNQRSETLMAAGRGLLVKGLLQNPDALNGMVPKGVPGLLVPALRSLARLSNQWFVRKYEMKTSLEDYREQSLKGLDGLMARLGERDYLLDHFSYADITMAVALHMLSPVPKQYMAALPGTRRFRDEALLKRYAALIAWRDRLYARHRPPNR